MSNTLHTRKVRTVVKRDDLDGVDEIDGVDYYDDLDDQQEEVWAEPEVEVARAEERTPGLLSSPGRVAALGFSVVLMLAVFSGVIYLLGNRPSQASATGTGNLQVAPRVGSLAPDFTLINVRDNKDLTLSSLRGKPVFMNFWGTWCPPCRYEMPEMQKFYQKNKNEIEVLGVSMYPRDDPATVLNFIQQYSYSWTFVHDADYSVATAYIVNAIPSSYFIDKNGVIRVIKIGPMDSPMMEAYFQQTQAAGQ